ncbi:unnamed protein product [Cylicocyclus nassatus]|uniref:Uncharacterized protein n=1 Tax=Cylicocyclus nassatus TaxID=53992 RepID=A0AA36H0H3_CYLNA|nr:unnamed protein product [Cylicocyclus nassatus]
MVDDIPPTFVPLNATFESIDPLANATGILGSDKIQVGRKDISHFVIPNVTFGLALDMQTTELDGVQSGVLGLGLNNVGTNSEPFIRSIFDQGYLRVG